MNLQSNCRKNMLEHCRDIFQFFGEEPLTRINKKKSPKYGLGKVIQKSANQFSNKFLKELLNNSEEIPFSLLFIYIFSEEIPGKMIEKLPEGMAKEIAKEIPK